MEYVKRNISVITICYNCAADLEKTILSVIDQTYKDIEYIVVDGSSTDGTCEILRKYKSNIDICISEPDDGIYDAMNKGLRCASGEWIICMNAGDAFHDNDVLQKVFSLDIPKEKTFLYSDLHVIDNKGNESVVPCNRHTGDVHHQNAIYRRSLHAEHGFYIVTKTYIISDLMFFMTVPESEYMKLSFPIAIVNVSNGTSAQGTWCAEQTWALKTVFGIETIPHMFFRYLRMHFGTWRRKIFHA